MQMHHINNIMHHINNCYVKKIILNRSKTERKILCVELQSTLIKKSILKEKGKNKDKLNSKFLFKTENSNNIYINDKISKNCRDLFNCALDLKRNKKLNSVWIRNNNILIKRRVDSEPILITSMNMLQNII
jgi:ribosomal protein S8